MHDTIIFDVLTDSEFSALGVAIPDEHLTFDLPAADPMDFDAGSETPGT